MVFNILMDNTDDHEKNHTLLVPQPFDNGHLKLAPAYDLLPTNSGQGFQEFGCGVHGKDSTLVNAMSEFEAFGLLTCSPPCRTKVMEQSHTRACIALSSDITSMPSPKG